MKYSIVYYHLLISNNNIYLYQLNCKGQVPNVYKLTPKDRSLLLEIAEYRILLIDQIVLLDNTGKRAVQKKVNTLYKNGIFNFSPRNFETNRGRPENIISISEKGVRLLQYENLIDSKIPIERLAPDKSYHIEHELLLNWFRVYLNYISEKIQDLTIDFISSTTPFVLLNSNGLPLISESFKQVTRYIDFIPDGVFSVISKEQNKSLLFFLEIDMGTESLKSSSLNSNNIATKIKNYRVYFQSQKYKRYETRWNTKFNGFRLLFLTNSTFRRSTLLRFISSERTNDFIWITDQDEMFQHGIGGKIWTRGGDTSSSPESILGPTLANNLSAS